MNRHLILAIMFATALSVSACNEQQAEIALPNPVALTEEAVGHYCNMTIVEHTGPKAQIHLAGNPNPIWFSQVRDGIAFIKSPEEHDDYVAVYVNDMGKATDWDFPADDTWIDANLAWFVIGSRITGGMGAPEVIPFGSEESASAFVTENGGAMVRLADIPDAYVLGPTGLDEQASYPITGATQ